MRRLMNVEKLVSSPRKRVVSLPVRDGLHRKLSLARCVVSYCKTHGNIISATMQASSTKCLAHELIRMIRRVIMHEASYNAAQNVSIDPQGKVVPREVFVRALVNHMLTSSVCVKAQYITVQGRSVKVKLIGQFVAFRARPVPVQAPFAYGDAS